MNSEVPKWMPPESAVCVPSRSEGASQNKTEEEGEEEMERCKRPRTTLDSEGGVEEFLILLERIEEMKKHLKKKGTNCTGSCIIAEGGINAAKEDQTLMAMPGMQQAHGSSDAIDMTAYNKSSTSPWKPSFQWEDFNISNSRSAKTDLSCGEATETSKGEEASIQIGNGVLKTNFFLDGDKPAECSHDHVDDVNNKEEDVDPPPKLELQLFPV